MEWNQINYSYYVYSKKKSESKNLVQDLIYYLSLRKLFTLSVTSGPQNVCNYYIIIFSTFIFLNFNL